MQKTMKRVLAFMLSLLMVVSMGLPTNAIAKTAKKTAKTSTTTTFQTKIEFEKANRFEQNGRNRIDKSMFSGYSGDGYVYLEAGWGEVNFTVPQDGNYKITIVTNADSYKENWLYLDDNGAGTLKTSGNKWQKDTQTVYLTKGTHKFGVSSNWGYTALDYVTVESEKATVTEPDKPDTGDTDKPGTGDTDKPSTGDSDTYSKVIEFEDANRFEANGSNKIAKDQFSGYSGSGYLYLVSGWGEVGFTVPADGEYKITIVSNADSYKENWLYLDNDGAGALKTSGNKWQKDTYTFKLTKGTHKFGVSSSWGYTALDYVKVEAVSKGTDKPGTGDTDKPGSGDIDKPGTGETEKPDTGDTKPQGNGMYVKNGKLYDGNGNEFLMRGVNVAHAWYTGKTETSINAIASLGANAVRVVLADGAQWDKTSYDEVKNIISLCESKGLVCIVEVHDHTGKDSPSEIDTAVNYWLEMKDLLNAHKDYVIVNIANEWLGTWGKGSTWTSTYQSAIRRMRSNGIENVIMVDAAGYGQETSTCISNCQSVASADTTGNTMFSIHMYSVAGKDADTVKSNIDGMLSKDVAFCIGEFGDFQNGGDVDEATIMKYCTEKKVGYAAWSWKGNGGTDVTLDMSSDWAGTNLTTWGKYVFCEPSYGIQATSKMAYTLKSYDGKKSEGPVEQPDKPDSGSGDITTPGTDEQTDIKPGLLGSLKDWYVSGEGDDSESTITTMEALANGGVRVNFDLTAEKYPYLSNMPAGLDLSKKKTVDVVVRNNNLYPLQIQPIFKVGSLWKWTEYDKYQEVPAQSTVMLSFDLSKCPNLDQVMAVMFRIQGSGSSFAGSLDFFAVTTDYNYTKDPYASAIAELNRPKTAAQFTWKYAETSWEATKSYSCDKDGVITVDFANVTSEDAAGPQTETRPGTGKGSDYSAYGKVVSTITNNSDKDIHITLVMKTTGDWIWQENAGTVKGKGGERVIAPGETVTVTYSLTSATWKSKASGWKYSGKLQGVDDVRALAFKIYANEGEKVTGSVTISDFSFEF